MAHTLDIIDKLFNDLNALQPIKSEDKNRLDKKFRLEFNYNSNHMEGNTLTYGETELLLMFDDTLGNHQLREYEEIKAHDLAYHIIEDLAKDTERPLTEQIIKNLNEIILVRPYWKDAITPDGHNTRRQIKVGSYKEYPNSVRLQNGEMFEYASPTETPAKMQELIEWYREEESVLHPITLASMLHYKFVCIHPFDDGNGRIARLLMNYVLLKNNFPPVVIKSADKNNYLRALHIADLGDYEALITYVAENAIWSLELSIKAAKGESLEETGDFVKEIELLKRKASSQKTPKSPLVIYETFNQIKNKLWRSVNGILQHFDDLFNEAKSIYKLNGWNENFETRTVSTFNIPFTKEVSDKPKALKIFGYDIYSEDIEKLEFVNIMYGLRGSIKPENLSLKLEVNFNLYDYLFKIKLNDKSIFESRKIYKEIFLDNEISEINVVTQKHILEFLKEKMN
ncbi:Fic family protein [Mucilaginibacter terrae]|uniref:Fic family protein n=1 Tax=Mucilaginibacter terrae TaxID=1955052 RepID=A0ABU3GSV9_9SPHI|nr:Fic family protein [Mucilaginibacter terrae]MDT3401750.1 Fic family protein [Mucilaginibacter terrae]